FERDGVAPQLGDELGLLDDDVAPELHAVAARGDERVHLLQELEVDAHLAFFGDGGRRAALAEIEGLVEADVELAAAEVRKQLVVEVGEQVEGARIGGAEAERLAPLAERVLDA